MSQTNTQKTVKKQNSYPNFSKINGDHPLKRAVKNMYVGYDVVHRSEGEVAYFNFELAIEMGLLPGSHSHRLNNELAREIVHAFSLRIINEYDILNNTPINKKDVASNQYMATRYLQLQHPNKFGMTSGDGRSIWNGHFKGRHGHWDISSCGTGATRLSPASAIEKKFFRTGSKTASYGCGLAGYREGLIAAIYSDLMHKNGIPTERTLAIIRYKNGMAVNVRAAKNLLRPAHFFGFMKRQDYVSLKALMDYCIQREVENKNFPVVKKQADRYQEFLKNIARNFAKAAALFESEYIFCWMDWDGDNILFNGGIIDYGTIRQFGLFHHEYRYDDVNKMSTTITEQKNKAKFTVQVFAHTMDFLLTGKSKPVSVFKQHDAVMLFEKTFLRAKLERLIWRIGFTEEQIAQLLADDAVLAVCEKFQVKFRFFEKAMSRRKAYQVADGITRDAIFCMRDFLREFPLYYQKNGCFMDEETFIDLVASSYASRLDKSQYRKKSAQIRSLQRLYVDLVKQSSERLGIEFSLLLERSSVINRYEKLTGNAVITVVDRWVKARSHLSVTEMHQLITEIVNQQVVRPSYSARRVKKYRQSAQVNKLLNWSHKTMKENRDSI